VSDDLAEPLRVQVRDALERGGTQRLQEELEFVLRALARSDSRGVGSALANLEAGVSPYHVFGSYELSLGDPDSVIEVAREVMPPGANTRRVIEEIDPLARELCGGTIVDFGCGSGVLGLSALRASPRARGVMIDIDPRACALAERNLRGLALARRAHVVCADSMEAVDDWASVRLVVANLPFVPSAEVADLPARFAVHSPSVAVDGGPDGLAVIRPAIETLESRARPGTLVVLQVAPGRAPEVRGMFGADWRSAAEAPRKGEEPAGDALSVTAVVCRASGEPPE
jgi:release factor glutamine methyltransferase